MDGKMKKIIITVVVVSLIAFLAIFIVMRNTAGDTIIQIVKDLEQVEFRLVRD